MFSIYVLDKTHNYISFYHVPISLGHIVNTKDQPKVQAECFT